MMPTACVLGFGIGVMSMKVMRLSSVAFTTPMQFGPDDAHAGLARDGGQAFLLGDAVFLAGLGIAGGEDDGAADAGLGAVEHDLLDRLARGGDHGAIHAPRAGRARWDSRSCSPIV